MKRGEKVQEKVINFNIGDQIEIIEGGFSGLLGEIEETNNTTMIVKVSVTIFGRSTTIELPFSHISLT